MKNKLKWKRWFILLVFVPGVMYYFGVFNRPLRMTRENTGLTSLPAGVEVPIRADGKGVDYVRAYELLFPPVSEITPENAWRDVVRELGPCVFFDSSGGEEFSSWLTGFSQSHAAYWQEYCRRLALDPAEVKALTEPFIHPDDVMVAYLDDMDRGEEVMHEGNFLEDGWSREEFPKLAAWVDKHSPALDLVAAAVRKPRYFMPFLKERDDQPLPAQEVADIHFQQQLASGLQLRTTMYLYAGDAEKVLADIESLWRLSRHVAQMPDMAAQATAIGVARNAEEVTRGLLAQNICTPEQWERFAEMLASLPELPPFEDFVTVWDWQVYERLGEMTDYPLVCGTLKRLDPNIAVPRYAQLCRMRMEAKSHDALKAICLQGPYSDFWPGVRSTRAAEVVWDSYAGPVTTQYKERQFQRARFHKLRLAVALKRYKTSHGSYPESLDALVPEYLASVATPGEELPNLFCVISRPVLLPVRYERKDNGFVLYPGGNGVNEGEPIIYEDN